MGVSLGKTDLSNLPSVVKIIGTGSGATNTGWMGFYQADGTTRLGWIGDGGSGSEDLSFNATGGNVSIGAGPGFVEVMASDGTVTFGKKGNRLVDYTFPSLMNGWVQYAGSPSYEYASYYQTIDGMVHLSGAVKSGSNGQLFSSAIPAGLRPANKIAFNINCGTGYQNGYVTVDTGGIVSINVPSGANGWAVLDGILWYAYQ